MQAPLEVTFRGMSPSPTVEASIQRWIHRLERNVGGIEHCSVVIDQPHRHGRQGNRFHVRLGLHVAGRDIAVARDPERDGRHENLYVAIADAFRAARRQILDYSEMRHA
jgi:hypothetical protein